MTRKTALLVLDVKAGLVKHLGVAAVEPLGAIATALAAARASGVCVVYDSLAFRKGGPETGRRNPLFRSGKVMATNDEEDPESRIHPRVTPRHGDIVITRRRVGAFSGGDLDVVLRAQEVTRLVMAGMTTGGAVLSAVRAAADLDFELIVLSDACADADPDLQATLMGKVFPRQATVQTVSEWMETLPRAK